MHAHCLHIESTIGRVTPCITVAAQSSRRIAYTLRQRLRNVLFGPPLNYHTVSTRVYFRTRSTHFHAIGWKHYAFLSRVSSTDARY